jgi:hypothetical protein
VAVKDFALISFLLLSFLAAPLGSAYAQEFHDLYVGTREQAMGGASVAITQDDEAIYLNPAAMAGNKGFKIYLLNLNVEVSSDAVNDIKNSATVFNNIGPTSLQNFVGQNIETRAELTTGLTIPNFGMSYLVDQQVALQVQNLSNPNVLFGLQTTNGFQFATGFSLLSKNKKSQDDLRVGLGFKFMYRRGGYNDLDLQQILNISQSEIKTITGNYGVGEDGDLGLQYIRTLNKKWKLMAGLDYQDVGGMAFSTGGQTQQENLGMGIGAKFSPSRLLDITLGYDLKNLTQDMPFERKNHVGLEFAFPILRLQLGLSEGAYFSYGATTDFWLMSVSLLSYEEELGEDPGQDGERRYMVRIALKF